ncbi:MAG: Rpn family recombination-promoting nuclease/putative transposase [Roseburia sp.]|nr:Rpn family recombination-promoting nuclease/putative transposase [Roseburia sp.]MCM1243239.1 Rpn family recombination-promoting nuclease/putative transposase [Roseburia sp.]
MKNTVTETTKLEDLNLVDKFLFDETMEDKEAYQALIGLLLENETELLTRPETEKEIRISPQLRQIRLDVVSMDWEKKLYYTEMQKRNTGNLIRRSRYYQAQLDVSLLEPGSTDFNMLNDSCFILIAPFDIFGKGLYRYTFEGTCRECPELKLRDGSVRIFINTKGKNREDFSIEFLDFMEYITESTDELADKTQSDRIKLIHERVKKIKASEKAGVRYMQHWEEIAYARQDGVAEGLKEGLEEGIKNSLSICREFGMSRESALDKLKEKFQFGDGKAQEYMEKYWL